MIDFEEVPIPDAPKEFFANIEHREEMIEAGATNEANRQAIWIKSARDPVWWCDTFCSTYSPLQFPENPYRPFILWDHQEDVVRRMWHIIGHDDLPIKKSRNEGASW